MPRDTSWLFLSVLILHSEAYKVDWTVRPTSRFLSHAMDVKAYKKKSAKCECKKKIQPYAKKKTGCGIRHHIWTCSIGTYRISKIYPRAVGIQRASSVDILIKRTYEHTEFSEWAVRGDRSS